MKAHLMYRDDDFDLDRELPPSACDLTKDLELDILFDAMAAGDGFLRKAARAAVLSGVADLDRITYRHGILSDCLRYPREVKDLYELIVGSIEGEKRARWWGFGSGRSPSLVLTGALRLMEYYVDELRGLRDRAKELAGKFSSTGFRELCSMLASELSEDYLAQVQSHLKELEFRRGVLISADLGEGLKGSEYLIREPNDDRRRWIDRLFAKKPESYTYTIPDRDEAGARALSNLRDRGINPVANALAQSADHVRSFFAMLRSELAFYVGCLNLQERLTEIGEPICIPKASETGSAHRSFEELYDVSLALTANRKVVGNDVDAGGRHLVIITGANHGGKSTFLRSVGISQLMMQSGMFVGASSYESSVCSAVFTHFKRQEDAEMESGKFDEELGRMSAITDDLSPNALVLFNESFAATNEREGSEIARQVVRALVENGVSVFFVTHQYDFARSTHEAPPTSSLFLRAERSSDGNRSFKLVEAPPLETSYGKDLYREVFENTTGAVERQSTNGNHSGTNGRHGDNGQVTGDASIAGSKEASHRT